MTTNSLLYLRYAKNLKVIRLRPQCAHLYNPLVWTIWKAELPLLHYIEVYS